MSSSGERAITRTVQLLGMTRTLSNYTVLLMILDQSCMTRSSITTLLYTHLEITQFFVNINFYLMFTSGKPVLNFDGLKKGCDLEHKIVQFGNKMHC